MGTQYRFVRLAGPDNNNNVIMYNTCNYSNCYYLRNNV